MSYNNNKNSMPQIYFFSNSSQWYPVIITSKEVQDETKQKSKLRFFWR